VPSVASQAAAVRHTAQLTQGPRNIQSPDDADQTSPFSALLNEATQPAAPPPAPARTGVVATSQRSAARPQDGVPVRPPQDGSPPRPAAAESSASQQRSPADSTPPPQAPSPAAGQKTPEAGRVSTDAVPAAIPSDPTANVSVDDPTAGNGAAAPTDRRDDKTAKSDTDSDNTAAETVAPAAVGQQVATPQPVAAALALTATVSAPPVSDTSQNASDNGEHSPTGVSTPDTGQIAALGDALAGGGRGKADRPVAPPTRTDDAAGGATEGSGAKPGARLGAKTSDAARPTPSPAASGQADGGVQVTQAASLALAAQTASAPETHAAATATASPPAVSIAGIAVEIAAQAQAGRSRFDIRLDPPELGRIDVRLDVDRDGKVTSRVVVDRPETLDILRRDASEIERSLQQAGLKTADNNALQFSLRDNGTSGGFGNFSGHNPYPNNGSPGGSTRLIIPDRDLSPLDATAAGYGGAGGVGGIDIRV